MTNEELFKEAEIRFPVDTLFKSAKSYHLCRITNPGFYVSSIGIRAKSCDSLKRDLSIINRAIRPYVYIFDNNKWAEIVGKSEIVFDIFI